MKLIFMGLCAAWHFVFCDAIIGRAQKAAMQIIPRKILRPAVAGKYYRPRISRWRFIKFFAAPQVAASGGRRDSEAVFADSGAPYLCNRKISATRHDPQFHHISNEASETSWPTGCCMLRRNSHAHSFRCGISTARTASRYQRSAIAEIRQGVAGYSSRCRQGDAN